jgi:hypothetical protein
MILGGKNKSNQMQARLNKKYEGGETVERKIEISIN